MDKKEFDVVNNPKHYCSGAHECIDVMEWMFGIDAVINFCKCNIFKYRFRSGDKNGEEDIKKAEWYENKLKELLDKKFRLSKNPNYGIMDSSYKGVDIYDNKLS